MPWRSSVSWAPNQKLHADDLNNLAWDDRIWGGDVDGGGYTLSNVHVIEAADRAGGGAVTSVFGRTGDVVATNGDYTPAQVGAVPLARQVLAGSGMTGGGVLTGDVTLNARVWSVFGRFQDVTLTGADITAAGGVLNSRRINTDAGSGLTGGGNLIADLHLSVVPDTSNQQVQVMAQGTLVGSPRPKINFVSGGGALVTVQEITASNRIDVTIASSGSAVGMVDPTQIQGDLIVRGLTAPPTRLPIGQDGQVLTADHLQPQSVKWATPALVAVTSVFNRTNDVVAATGDYSAAQVTNAVDQTGTYNNPQWIASLPWQKITNAPAFLVDPTMAKGDLIVHGTATTRLPAGAPGTILTSDSAATFGVRWGAIPVTSVFGRTGDVVAKSDDYDVSQVTGAVPKTTTINTVPGSGLQGGGSLGGNLSLSQVPDSTNQQVQVLLGGAPKGQRCALNFKSGAGVALSISENTLSNWIDITVASTGSGSGGGMVDPTSASGDLIVREASLPAPPVALPLGTNGQVLTVDTSLLKGMKWAMPISGGAGSQTPWVGPIDAAGNNLNAAGGIGVNAASNKTATRVYVVVNSAEEGVATKSNLAAGLAGMSVTNDVGSALRLRSYGSGYVGALPAIATLEADNILAFLANSAEVMRLKAGRVLIGTTTDDGLNRLQVNGKVKSLVGGFVFPDDTVQTTAYSSASVPVTSVFTRTGAIVATLGDYTAALVTNAVDSSTTYNNPAWINTLAWSKITGAPAFITNPLTTKGDIIAYSTVPVRVGVGSPGQVLTADTAATAGVKWAAPVVVQQTPWTQDIDAGGFRLFNTGNVGIGTTSPDARLVVTSPGAAYNSATGQFKVTDSADSRRMLRMGYDPAIESSWIQSTYAGLGFEPLLLNPNGGNVGIGTTSPGTRLDVQGGSIRISNDSAIGSLQIGQYGSYLGRQATDGSTILQTAQGAILLNPGAAANVGIGTSSPQALLHMQKSATGGVTPYIYLQNATAADSAVMRIAGIGYGGIIQTSIDFVQNSATSWLSYLTLNTFNGAALVEGLRVTSQSLVGIGTNNPQTVLQVHNPAGQGSTVGSTSNNVQFSVNDPNADQLRFYNLRTVADSSWTGCEWRMQRVIDGTFAAWISLSQEVAFGTGLNGTEKMRITGTGQVGIGKSPAYSMDISGDCNVTGTYRVNGAAFSGGVSVQINNAVQGGPYAWLNFFAQAGIGLINMGVGGPGNNTITIGISASSDIQLKRNVERLSGGLPLITQLRPITAEWNGLANTREGERLVSVIAQELQEIIPDAVYPYRTKLRPEDKEETELLGYDHMALTCHLILAIQELERRLKSLEQKVN